MDLKLIFHLQQFDL